MCAWSSLMLSQQSRWVKGPKHKKEIEQTSIAVSVSSPSCVLSAVSCCTNLVASHSSSFSGLHGCRQPPVANLSAASFPTSPECPATHSNRMVLGDLRSIKASRYRISSRFATLDPLDVLKPFLRQLGSQSIIPI